MAVQWLWNGMQWLLRKPPAALFLLFTQLQACAMARIEQVSDILHAVCCSHTHLHYFTLSSPPPARHQQCGS